RREKPPGLSRPPGPRLNKDRHRLPRRASHAASPPSRSSRRPRWPAQRRWGPSPNWPLTGKPPPSPLRRRHHPLRPQNRSHRRRSNRPRHPNTAAQPWGRLEACLGKKAGWKPAPRRTAQSPGGSRPPLARAPSRLRTQQSPPEHLVDPSPEPYLPVHDHDRHAFAVRLHQFRVAVNVDSGQDEAVALLLGLKQLPGVLAEMASLPRVEDHLDVIELRSRPPGEKPWKWHVSLLLCRAQHTARTRLSDPIVRVRGFCYPKEFKGQTLAARIDPVPERG